MSSSVYQGLQTCLEPRLVEPRVLRLKLAPPPSPAATSANDTGGWSFLQCLDNANSNSNSSISKDEKVYVHPMAKRSASKLSAKSLAMCTESLGSETGSESGDDISMLSLESSGKFQRTERSELMTSKKQSRGDLTFPPPLTSISGSSGVRVRPHREGGRLILKAENVPPPNTNLLSERSNGRLRIRLLTGHDSVSEHESGEANHETEEPNKKTEPIHENDQKTEDAEQETESIHENDKKTEDLDKKTEHKQEGDEEDEFVSENEGEGGYWGGNFGDIGGKIGIENFQRPRSRCKEGGQGNNGFLNKNWENHFGWLLKPICLS